MYKTIHLSALCNRRDWNSLVSISRVDKSQCIHKEIPHSQEKWKEQGDLCVQMGKNIQYKKFKWKRKVKYNVHKNATFYVKWEDTNLYFFTLNFIR